MLYSFMSSDAVLFLVPFRTYKVAPIHVAPIVKSLTVCTARQAHHCISSIYVYKYLYYFSKMIIIG